MFLIAHAFKGQVHVYAGQVKILRHSSCKQTKQNKQTNFYLRSDNNMLHMSRYNMYNNTSYRGGCAKK